MLKLRSDTPQVYEDIHYKDITLNGAGTLINVAPWTQYFDLMGQPQPQQVVRNITLTDVKGTWGSFGSIRGNAGNTIENFTLENIDLQLTGAPARGATTQAAPRLDAVKNLVIKNVKLNGVELKGP